MTEKRQHTVLHFRTIVLSDVHLGAPDCQIDKVNHFLKHTHCDKLILNGDIIDGWSLGRRGGWAKEHTRFLRLVLRKIEQERMQVIYLRGNHDDFLDRFLPLVFGTLQVTDRHIHEGLQGRYLVLHGDVFDAVTTHSRLLAIAGDVGYQALLRLNRTYNRYRAWRGKEYFSFSKAIKARTKNVVNRISNFESNIEHFAKREQCTGFICGHIHTPENKFIGTIHYLNSGDWIESNTALIENADGHWEVLPYEAFCARLDASERQADELHPERSKPVALNALRLDEDEDEDDEHPAIFIPA